MGESEVKLKRGKKEGRVKRPSGVVWDGQPAVAAI